MSFTCRLLDRLSGRWLHAGTPKICTGALACKARTCLHYSLPLTIHEVGIAGCTTTCSFTNLYSRRYIGSLLPRIALPLSPAAAEDIGGRTCLVGPALHRRDTMGSAPFPPLPTVSSARPLLRTPAETGRPEFLLRWGQARTRTAMSGSRRLSPERLCPNVYTIRIVKELTRGIKKPRLV